MGMNPIGATLPDAPAPGQKISAQWGKDVVDNLRRLRGTDGIDGPLRRGFNLYYLTPFAVTMTDELHYAVAAGSIYVHANASSPFAVAAATGDLDSASTERRIFVSFNWETAVGSIVDAAATYPVSNESYLRIPLATVTRYGTGTGTTPYVFTITTIHHMGDIHICGNTGTITAGNGEGFRSTRTGNPGINVTAEPIALINTIDVQGGRITAKSP